MPMANGVGKICYKKRGLSMSAIAIITARGGSKRIPKKNIKEFCGKPIIAYSIEAAFASKIFTEVMVSTDDPEIADMMIWANVTEDELKEKKEIQTTFGETLSFKIL